MKEFFQAVWGLFVFVVLVAGLVVRCEADRLKGQRTSTYETAPLYAPVRVAPSRTTEPLPVLKTTWRTERERWEAEARLGELLKQQELLRRTRPVPDAGRPVEVAPMPREVPQRFGAKPARVRPALGGSADR